MHPPTTRRKPSDDQFAADRSMTLLQYAIAGMAIVAAILIGVVR